MKRVVQFWRVGGPASLVTCLWFVLGQTAGAQIQTEIIAGVNTLNEFELELEARTGVRLPITEFCTPGAFSKPEFPIRCFYGNGSVLVTSYSAGRLEAFERLAGPSTNGNWLDPKSDPKLANSLSSLEWNLSPVLIWQSTTSSSTAICGYADPSSIVQDAGFEIQMAATCYLVLSGGQYDDGIIEMQPETYEGMQSVFAPNESGDPFRSFVTFFMFNTTSFGIW